MEMSPRQRWVSLLERRTPDRIPTDYWSTGEFHNRLKKDLGCQDDEALWRRLHIDRPRFVGPRYTLPESPFGAGKDMWGIEYKTVDYGTGAYSEAATHPLAAFDSVAQIEKYRWPSPDDFDYTPIGAFLAKDDGYRPIQGAVYEPFLLYCYLRGIEQAFEDLLVNTEIAEAILTKEFEFFYEHNRRIYEAGKGRIDVTYVAEDLGSQTGPLMGVETYRKFLRENQRKMADLARKNKAHVFYHTDGSADVFLPDLVDYVGIEVLNPIQWRCPGMERERLVRDYGKRIGFHGAIDNQHTLPFGKPEDVVAEVKEGIKLFKGARWICAPCHNIQPVTPTANVVAMFETIHEFGKLG